MSLHFLGVIPIVLTFLPLQILYGQFGSGFPEGHVQGISKYWPSPMPSWPANHDEALSKAWGHDVQTSQGIGHESRISAGWPGGHHSSISASWPTGTEVSTHPVLVPFISAYTAPATTATTYPIHDVKASSTYGHTPNHYVFVSKTWGHVTKISRVGDHQLSISEHWPGNHVTNNSYI